MFIDSLGSGGAQRQFVVIANEFSKQHFVNVLVYHDEPFYEKKLSSRIGLIKVLHSSRILRMLGVIMKIVRLKPDVVYSFLETPNFISCLSRLLGNKHRVILNDRSSNSMLYKGYQTKFKKLVYLYSDMLITNSHSNLSLIKKNLPYSSKLQLRVVYNYVDSVVWNNAKKKREGKFKLVIVASHQNLKNSLGLVRAISLINKSYRNQLEVTWFGSDSGDGSKAISQNMINANGLTEVIRFENATNNIIDEYHNADAVGLFSHYEGLPNTICEALVCGLPVICSAVSDLPLLLEKTDNILVDSACPKNIANGIVKFINMSDDNLKNIGQKNREIFSKLFGYDKTVDVLINILNEEIE